jgi:hypothetical protein
MHRTAIGRALEDDMSDEERELLHNHPVVAMTPEENEASLKMARWQEINGLGAEMQTAQVEPV